MLVIAATSAAAAQTYPYFGPYGYGAFGPNKLPGVDAKLGAEPTKLWAEFARRRRYLRRAVRRTAEMQVAGRLPLAVD